MRKFLAVVRREYTQRVRAKMFIVVTVLAPVVISGFAVAPALIFSIKTGGPVRIERAVRLVWVCEAFRCFLWRGQYVLQSVGSEG